MGFSDIRLRFLDALFMCLWAPAFIVASHTVTLSEPVHRLIILSCTAVMALSVLLMAVLLFQLALHGFVLLCIRWREWRSPSQGDGP